MRKNNYLQQFFLAPWRCFGFGNLQTWLLGMALTLMLFMPNQSNAQCETPINSFPFSEGFEDVLTLECWDYEYVQISDTWEENVDWALVEDNFSGNVLPHGGSAMAMAYHDDYGAITNLITPSFDLTGLTTPYLRFYYTNESWAGDIDELSVLYKTSAAGEWIQLGATIIDAHSTWQEFAIELPGASNEYYIAFQAATNYGYGLTIDDVWVGEAPTCNTPASLTAVVEANQTSITIGWLAPTPAPDNGYEYVLSTSNSAPEGAGTPTTDLSVLVSDLTFGTYYLYVRAICAEGNESEWAGPVQATIIEGDVCASAIDLTTLTSPFNGTTVGANANFSIDCAGGNTSPELFYYIEVPADYTLVIGQTVNGYDSENYLGYGDCPGSGGTTTQIACYDDSDTQTNTWVNTTGSTQTVYWVQDGYNVVTQVGAFTLAWSLTAPPPCTEPINLTATPTSASTATIGWTPDGDAPAGGYQYVFSSSDSEPTEDGIATTEVSVDVTDLTFGTYYLFVRSDCDNGDFTEWMGPVAMSIVEGDICETAIDLATLTSPFDGTTVGASANYSIDCAFGNTSPELFYYIEVPANYTLVIGQTVNGYDSENYLGYGDCPGSGGTTTQIACYDDSDTQTNTWVNTTGETQTVYWVQDGYNVVTQVGTFTLAWTLTAPPLCPEPEDLTATITSASTADLSWTYVGTTPNGGFEYVFSTDAASPAGAGTQTSETSVSVSDLTFATYYLYVRSICDDEATEWVGPVSVSIVEGDICATAINLENLTSPFTGTTVGASANFSNDCSFFK